MIEMNTYYHEEYFYPTFNPSSSLPEWILVRIICRISASTKDAGQAKLIHWERKESTVAPGEGRLRDKTHKSVWADHTWAHEKKADLNEGFLDKTAYNEVFLLL